MEIALRFFTSGIKHMSSKKHARTSLENLLERFSVQGKTRFLMLLSIFTGYI
jgi:hypothetical protein